jgi:GDPmannose 4,6-dehydratase
MKTALILGVSGQDGAYLSEFLLAKNYAVHGTSRDATRNDFARLHILGIRDRIATHSVSTTDRAAVRHVLAAVRPDEIYNLGGLSSVALSFRDPDAARASIADAQLLLLESVREIVPSARVYHSASSECFGDIPEGSAACEETPFAPRSPYAEAKAAAHGATVEYRDRHGLHASSGILFNHESPLRGETFVTKKIVDAARHGRKVSLGDLSASRDWGYAPEYAEGMWRMLQQREPGDFVIATGESHTVEEFASAAFAELGRDHREYVSTDPSLVRPNELHYSRGNPFRARTVLGWEARTKFHALVHCLTREQTRISALHA